MTAMTNVKAEELILDNTDYLALSCPICNYTLGIKYVSLLTLICLETKLFLVEDSFQN